MDLVQEFWDLFKPLDRAYGYYIPGKIYDSNGKLAGKAVTKREPLTYDIIKSHLAANAADGVTIGGVPIRDDNCAHYGAIDIDLYKDTIDQKALVLQIQKLKLPLVAVVSKSGGMHLYVFFNEPVPCGIIQKHLTDYADLLGYPGVEIFPKQVELRPEDAGNWINLPYQGSLHPDTRVTNRYGFDSEGEIIPKLEDWIHYVKDCAIDKDRFEKVKLPSLDAPFSDGPPCLQHLAAAGVSDMRNVVLMNMGVYAKQKFPSEWHTKMHDYNKEYDPPLPSNEVQQLIGSLEKKSYFYQCQTQPMCTFCHRNKCLSRQFGIGDAGSVTQRIKFGSITKQVVVDNSGEETDDPPMYFWTLNGRQIPFTMDEIQTQRLFRRKVSERLDTIPVMLKDPQWLAMVNELMHEGMETIEAPFESGIYGQFISLLYAFVEERARGEQITDIFEECTFIDREAGRAYFRWQDFKAYLDSRQFKSMPQREQWSTMRKYADALSVIKSLGGRTVRYWDIKYTEEHEAASVNRTELEF